MGKVTMQVFKEEIEMVELILSDYPKLEAELSPKKRVIKFKTLKDSEIFYQVLKRRRYANHDLGEQK